MELQRPNKFQTEDQKRLAQEQLANKIRQERLKQEQEGKAVWAAASKRKAEAKLQKPGARPTRAKAPVARAPVNKREVIARPAPKAKPIRVIEKAPRTVAPIRRAGTAISQLLGPDGDALTKWLSRDSIDNGPNWYNKSEATWLNDNRQLRSDLNPFIKNGDEESIRRLLHQNGYRYDELEAQIKELEGANSTSRLRQVRYNVPHAAADEQIAIAALKSAGLQGVIPGNINPIMGTDIAAKINGNDVTIDAQQRLGSSGKLNLGIFQGGRGLVQLVKQNPDSRLIDLIDNYRRTPGYWGGEDKLMQTMDSKWNKEPGERFLSNTNAFAKDGLISSYRPNNPKGSNHGPYNPKLPQEINYYDLAEMREDILGRSMNDLQRLEIASLYPNATNLKLRINKEYLHGLSRPVNMSNVNEFLRPQ